MPRGLLQLSIRRPHSSGYSRARGRSCTLVCRSGARDYRRMGLGFTHLLWGQFILTLIYHHSIANKEHLSHLFFLPLAGHRGNPRESAVSLHPVRTTTWTSASRKNCGHSDQQTWIHSTLGSNDDWLPAYRARPCERHRALGSYEAMGPRTFALPLNFSIVIN